MPLAHHWSPQQVETCSPHKVFTPPPHPPPIQKDTFIHNPHKHSHLHYTLVLYPYNSRKMQNSLCRMYKDRCRETIKILRAVCTMIWMWKTDAWIGKTRKTRPVFTLNSEKHQPIKSVQTDPSCADPQNIDFPQQIKMSTYLKTALNKSVNTLTVKTQ